ncbi:hypothetical protein [Microbacterium sp. SORGH_AS_0888]|uniref:PH-like domain-containing protein n=1 Tax=Microbacterium sp. SORGH_AS_0888 TaxID=3041791 RepID=UPI0027805B31|nr:hypothetical protein [Microbacterium sp. SORGH_AS_0888]MDQ1128515.1 hypothetical protein [Microbacterium sp. SORGH_AS_0888]
MTREAALLVMLGAAVLLLGLMAWGWWRRTRRDAGLIAPAGEMPADARVLGDFPGLYVATTAQGNPLERLAVRGLGFRARGLVVVTDAGILFDLAGAQRLFIDRARIAGVGQSTVAIDRVVERGGLVRLSWRAGDPGDDTVVDSYFRPQEASARALVAAIEPLLPSATPTGTQG